MQKSPKKVSYFSKIEEMSQIIIFMFLNVAYRATLYENWAKDQSEHFLFLPNYTFTLGFFMDRATVLQVYIY